MLAGYEAGRNTALPQSAESIRVIVGLEVGFAPEGSLRTAQAQAQRVSIAETQSQVLAAVAGLGAQDVKLFQSMPYMALRVSAEGLAALGAHSSVSSITPDEALPPALVESAALIGASTLWTSGVTGATRRVAVLDTGVDKTHPFLNGKVVSEACYSSTTATSTSLCPGGVAQSTASGSALDCTGTPGCGHGTHVAGIVAGKGSSFSGVARDAELIAIAIFSRFTDTTTCYGSTSCLRTFYSDQLLALERVYQLRTSGSFPTIDAVNMSLGAGRYTATCDSSLPAHKAAIDNLRSVGVATIIASANDGYADALAAPACISSAISVGSTRDGSSGSATDSVSPFSNSASFLSLLAPGETITSSAPGGGFSGMSGTSMSAPHVAGAWALYRQAQPSSSVDQVFAAFSSTGRPVTDTRNGLVKPRVQIDAALTGCSFGFAPSSASAVPAGGAASISITASRLSCAWTATTTAPWLTVATASGTGAGTVSYTVAPNATGAERSAVIRVASRDFQVTQLATSQQGPTIGSIYPAAGPTAGGTSVEIAGTGFASGTTVTVGGVVATGVTVVSATLLRAMTPARPVGPAPVVVTTPQQPSVTRANGFTYVSAPPSSTADTDGDGMPDFWEIRFGVDPLTPDGDRNPDADDRTNLQEYLGDSHPRGTFRRYLAEGATSSFFDTTIALLNVNAEPATVLLRYLESDGSLTTEFRSIGGLTRRTIDPKAVLGTAEFSTVVEADRPVIVDRTMTWDGKGYGSHADTAVEAPAVTWYLAEGATHSNFDLFYLLMNPNASAASVRVTYLRGSGAPIVKTYTVAPASRRTVWVNGEDEGLASAEVSAQITSTNDVPIIVERSMYLSKAGVMFLAGHESAGVTAPANQWFLAEGATGSFFDQYVLIANPSAADAQVTATYLLPTGATIVKSYSVRGSSRYTVAVDREDPALADTAVSVAIVSTQPIIVERTMWWPGPTAATWHEAHNGPGATATGAAWAVADGELGGARNVETYILIANTSAFQREARVSLVFEDGTTSQQTFPLAANSRFSVDVRREFAAAAGRRFGAIVEALGAPSPEIVVERAMYSNAAGVVWAAGTNALAVRLR